MIDRSGIVGEDGSTHQGIFDLSYLRQLPHMVILAPKDENELRRMIKTALEREDGPTAVRYPRGDGLGVPLDPEMTPIPIGSWEVLREGGEAVMLAVGSLVSPAMVSLRFASKRRVMRRRHQCEIVEPLDEALRRAWETNTNSSSRSRRTSSPVASGARSSNMPLITISLAES